MKRHNCNYSNSPNSKQQRMIELWLQSDDSESDDYENTTSPLAQPIVPSLDSVLHSLPLASNNINTNADVITQNQIALEPTIPIRPTAAEPTSNSNQEIQIIVEEIPFIENIQDNSLILLEPVDSIVSSLLPTDSSTSHTSQQNLSNIVTTSQCQNNPVSSTSVVEASTDSSDSDSSSHYSSSHLVTQCQGPSTANVIWYNVNGNLKNFLFASPSGPTTLCYDKINNSDKQPLDFFQLFVDNNLLDIIVAETNEYANQKIIHGITTETLSKNARMNLWKDVTTYEIKQFFGLLIWMGLDKKPALKSYWSTGILYSNKISQAMPRNRFESILSNIHFANNETAATDDKLYKISSLLEYLNKNFMSMYDPGESICIDETMVPFRGRLSFRQYIPGKRNKYGIKLFKLCTKGGYTYRAKVYAGKEERAGRSVASSVVLELMEKLLNTHRTLYTDNFYTSVELAHNLLDRRTHLVGTLRSNRKHNPTAVVKAKLKCGEMLALQSNTSVVVGKWKDRRDVLFLTTKHIPRCVPTNRNKTKPNVILDYNTAKSFIDVSDQLSSYATTIRKGIKWYRKVAIEFLTNTSVINSFHLYRCITGKTISITKFREQLALALIGEIPENTITSNEHKIEEVTQKGRCVTCYTSLSKQFGSQHSAKHAKQLKQKCSGCPDKFMCNDCFFSKHSVRVKNLQPNK